MTDQTTALSTATLEHALQVMEPLVCWLLRSGVGYTEFAVALKTVFYNQAVLESTRVGQKQTDSAISLLSGLHRKDVFSLRTGREADPNAQTPIKKGISLTAQVLGRWLANEWPMTIPIQGEDSFDALVRSISNDRHPRSVMHELERLGAVKVDDERVTLLEQAFTLNEQTQESQHIFTQNVVDHLAAGVHNLSLTDAASFLEQSVFADELTPESVTQLMSLSTDIWRNVIHTVLKEAVRLNDIDVGKPEANQRFRIGMYTWAEEEAPKESP